MTPLQSSIVGALEEVKRIDEFKESNKSFVDALIRGVHKEDARLKRISFMNKSKNFLSNPLNALVFLTCLVIIGYFGLRIYKELAPPNYKDQYMHCLELGSDSRAALCLRQLGKR